jgi:hypothetical protein
MILMMIYQIKFKELMEKELYWFIYEKLYEILHRKLDEEQTDLYITLLQLYSTKNLHMSWNVSLGLSLGLELELSWDVTWDLRASHSHTHPFPTHCIFRCRA